MIPRLPGSGLQAHAFAERLFLVNRRTICSVALLLSLEEGRKGMLSQPGLFQPIISWLLLFLLAGVGLVTQRLHLDRDEKMGTGKRVGGTRVMAGICVDQHLNFVLVCGE